MEVRGGGGADEEEGEEVEGITSAGGREGGWAWGRRRGGRHAGARVREMQSGEEEYVSSGSQEAW